jgi:hypothetical protein
MAHTEQVDPRIELVKTKRTPEERQAIFDAFTRTFTSADGQVVLAELDRILEAEDVPMFNIRDANAFAHHNGGRRSLLKTIKQFIHRRSTS